MLWTLPAHGMIWNDQKSTLEICLEFKKTAQLEEVKFIFNQAGRCFYDGLLILFGSQIPSRNISIFHL